MRYFQFSWPETPGDKEQTDWGGSNWYYEFSVDGSTTRQITLYDNGYRLRYDRNHSFDEYGELLLDVNLDDFTISQGQEITQSVFESVWQSGPWKNVRPTAGE